LNLNKVRKRREVREEGGRVQGQKRYCKEDAPSSLAGSKSFKEAQYKRFTGSVLKPKLGNVKKEI
jgi:hypothetical protein